MSSTVIKTLYRSLLKTAKRFDRHPALKGTITSNQFSVVGLKGLYSPSNCSSLVDLVKKNFRSKHKDLSIETAFSSLKYLNELDQKHFDLLYKQQAPLGPLVLSSPSPEKEQNIAQRPPRNLFSLFRKSEELPAPQLPVFSATPIKLPPSELTLPSAQTSEDGSLVATIESHSPAFQVIKEGVLLAAHPLLGDPFPKCVLWVMRTWKDHVSVLILNAPHAVELGKYNYLFPEYLRNQPCYIGGPLVSLQGLPPVPNYVIVHPYPSIPNSKVIMEHDKAPVCISTAADINNVVKFVEEKKASLRNFRIFIGTVEISKSYLASQIEQGLWMPINGSSSFILESARLGRERLWYELMKSCGGEYEHMSLVGQSIE